MALSAEAVREIFHYEPSTGQFRHRRNTCWHRNGDLAGAETPAGYVYIWIGNRADGARYAAHRLAWLYMTGAWPSRIDHRNGIRSDNRFCNLREAGVCENMQNQRAHADKRTKLKGAYWYGGRCKKWASMITANGQRTYLGLFETAEAAHAAYCAAALRLHGEFARFA